VIFELQFEDNSKNVNFLLGIKGVVHIVIGKPLSTLHRTLERVGFSFVDLLLADG
jgi:hypothetical protein